MDWRLRLLLVLLIVMLAVLQYRLWIGEGSLAEVSSLKQQIEMQRAEIDRLTERNQRLSIEVDDLKNGLDAIEARARRELGMIKQGETFYRVIPDNKDSSQ